MRVGTEPSYGAITFFAGGLRRTLTMWQPGTARVRVIHRALLRERPARMRAAVAQPFARNSRNLAPFVCAPTPMPLGRYQMMLRVYMAQANVGRSAP